MTFRSKLAQEPKLERALVVAFALAEVLVHAGERVGVPGLMRPTGSRNVLDKFANAVVHDPTERPSLPRAFAPSSLSEVVLISDFWSPIDDIRKTIAQLSSSARMAIPCRSSTRRKRPSYSGRIEFVEPEGGESITAGRAEAWRAEYEALVARHRAQIAPIPTRSAGASLSTGLIEQQPSCSWHCMRA